MSFDGRTAQSNDDSASSMSTKYSIRSFNTTATSPPRGPDPEDSGWYATTRTYPIKPSDDIVKAWVHDGLCEAAMGEIRSLEDWVSVDVLRRGVSLQPSDCPPTIVISIKPDSMEDGCIEVVMRVKRHIEHHDLDAAVEIIESSLCRQVDLGRITNPPGIGASIALKENPTASGTLGGYIRLEFPQEGSKICAMTCHHVFRRLDSTPTDVDQRGFRPQSMRASDRLVLSPSEADMEETKRVRLESLNVEEKLLRERKIEKGNGIISAARKRALEVYTQRARLAAERVRELEGYETELGYILASSGFRVAESGCAIDWGLIEVDEKRAGANFLREGDLDVPYAIGRLIKITEFDEEGTAIKFGRSTNKTTGRFSCVKSHCRLPDSQHETKEYVFCAVRGTVDSSLSAKGDSGAWVFNREGGLGGMIVAGHLQHPWSYVTPMTEIFEDIEKQLGCKVVLPDVY